MSLSQPLLSDALLAGVPVRHSNRRVVVLKFGGTTMGATPEQGRLRLARDTIARLLDEGRFVVPVFSAYRRGRSGSADKFSVTDLLQNHTDFVSEHDSLEAGVEAFGKQLLGVHLNLLEDLGLKDRPVRAKLEGDVRHLQELVALSCSAFENLPSVRDRIITAGERLAVNIMADYLNRSHETGKFPSAAAPVTAMELGIYTDNRFGSAGIDWVRAVEHSREVLFAQYLEKDIIPVVTGFDGIYDPHNDFQRIMQTPTEEQKGLDQRYARVHRTSLGRGGSDLTATFLGLALDAEYVGFCKETPGVLTADDMLVGDAARTVEELDYDLATEAGNIYGRAVEPVRAGKVPVHIFDPAQPGARTRVHDVDLPEGLYIVERPLETVNIHAGTIPDEPGALSDFLEIFSEEGVNVEEVRHQRSGTDCIALGDDAAMQRVLKRLGEQGLRPTAHHTWYIRVIGNTSEGLCRRFNEFMCEFEALTLAGWQVGTRVLTATVVRNRAGAQHDETARIEQLVQRVHDELLVPVGALTEA